MKYKLEYRLATTLEIRDIARQAFVTATGMCYDYRLAYTDKDRWFTHLRRVSFAVLRMEKAEKILSYMEQMLEEKKLVVMGLKLTKGGYIRCKAELVDNTRTV